MLTRVVFPENHSSGLGFGVWGLDGFSFLLLVFTGFSLSQTLGGFSFSLASCLLWLLMLESLCRLLLLLWLLPLPISEVRSPQASVTLFPCNRPVCASARSQGSLSDCGVICMSSDVNAYGVWASMERWETPVMK